MHTGRDAGRDAAPSGFSTTRWSLIISGANHDRDGNTPATMRDKADLKIASGEQSKQKDPLHALEDAVASTSGLLEALSCVLEMSATGKYAPLSDKAVDGLRTLAFAQVEQLHRSFDGYHAAVNRGRNEAS